MSLDINESIDNLLANITQKQADAWCDNHKHDRVPVDVFISNFQDYSRDGMISLITAFSMAHDEEEDIEKADTDQLAKCHKLIHNRLQSEGYSEEEIEERILDRLANSKDMGKLIREEVRRLKEAL